MELESGSQCSYFSYIWRDGRSAVPLLETTLLLGCDEAIFLFLCGGGIGTWKSNTFLPDSTRSEVDELDAGRGGIFLSTNVYFDDTSPLAANENVED